jgi:MFS family permease
MIGRRGKQMTSDASAKSLSMGQKKVVLASSLGTVFEWYDFYLYGSLAAIIAKQFFSGLNPTGAFIFALLAFAAGFAVRPLGALVFGRLGDLVGRKHTFLVTILIMGFSTFLVGVLPSYASIGVLAPVALIALRLLQGLALGGEYGGAATYVAEHAPHGRRGLHTSFIQTTATLGLFLSLLVILACRAWLGTEAFDAWGWRIPFLVSSVLLAISVWIRLQLNESPLFLQMKAEGKQSKAPLTESFLSKNGRIVLLALFGATAGQAVVWYCGQFYALFFLTQILKIDAAPANLLIAGALAIGTPFFVLFGWLSDKIGRKPVIMAGCLVAALTYFPIFHGLTWYGNRALADASAASPVSVASNPADCSFQFNPIGTKQFTTSCDVAKSSLANRGIPYENLTAVAGTPATIHVGQVVVASYQRGAASSADEAKRFDAQLKAALSNAGYPDKSDTSKLNVPMLLLLLTILVVYVAMVYGPIAAWLVELFPTRIRYTSMSLPYHIGNGWFGGFLPTTAFALVATTGNIYQGLWYPIIVAAVTVVVGTLFLPETRHVDISK